MDDMFAACVAHHHHLMDLGEVLERWGADPFAEDCGESRVRAGRHLEVLEGLREARLLVPALALELHAARAALSSFEPPREAGAR